MLMTKAISAPSFEDVRAKLIDWALRVPANDYEAEELRAYPSTRRTIAEDIVSAAEAHVIAAEAHVIANGLSAESFADVGHRGLVIFGILTSGLNPACREPRQPNQRTYWDFWPKHLTSGVPLVSGDDLHHELIESAASHYLALPYRVPSLDRLFAEALVASSTVPIRDALNDVGPWWAPASSPLRQWNTLACYPITLSVYGLTGGAASLGLQAIPQTSALSLLSWPLLAVVAISLLCALVDTATLIPRWWRQRTAKKAAKQTLDAIRAIERELFSPGVVSATRVRELAGHASSSGLKLLWPAPLFALIDDICNRGGIIAKSASGGRQ